MTVAETATATEMAMMTATIRKPCIDDSNEDDTPRMCLMARDRNVVSAFGGGGGDGEKKNRTKLNYTAQPPPARPIVRLFCCLCRYLLYRCRRAPPPHH